MINHIHPIIGFGSAGVSTLGLWLAQTASPSIEQWVQGGGTVGLIGGLSYGCVTLWKANQKSMADIAELNKEIRTDWKNQNERLINVLERLDSDK